MERISPPASVPDPTERPTLDLYPDVANILGISKDSVYKGAALGDIPVIRIGHRLKCPTAALRRMLALDDDPRPAA